MISLRSSGRRYGSTAKVGSGKSLCDAILKALCLLSHTHTHAPRGLQFNSSRSAAKPIQTRLSLSALPDGKFQKSTAKAWLAVQKKKMTTLVMVMTNLKFRWVARRKASRSGRKLEQDKEVKKKQAKGKREGERGRERDGRRKKGIGAGTKSEKGFVCMCFAWVVG